ATEHERTHMSASQRLQGKRPGVGACSLSRFGIVELSMPRSCRACSLPPALRTFVQELVAVKTLTLRKAARLTGCSPAGLHRPRNHSPTTAASTNSRRSEESAISHVSHGGIGVSALRDQSALVQLHSRKWPPTHSVEAAWAEVFARQSSPTVRGILDISA